MYPPKLAESLEEGIQNVVSSLQRAGPEHWTAQQKYEDVDGKTTTVYIKLREAIAKEAQPHVVDYTRRYLRACGFKVRSVSLCKRYCTVRVSNI